MPSYADGQRRLSGFHNNNWKLMLFAGVSCDACMNSNFSSLRFKCLVCYDYDLCASCHDSGATSSRHTVDHPMQCIMTRADLSECVTVFVIRVHVFFISPYGGVTSVHRHARAETRKCTGQLCFLKGHNCYTG